MTEDYKIGSIKHELQLYLNAQARKSAFLSTPLTLKAEFKNIPYVSDSSKKLYSIDMTHLISFRDTFNDKSCKFTLIQTNTFDYMIGNSISISRERNAFPLNLIQDILHSLLLKIQSNRSKIVHFCWKLPLKQPQKILIKLIKDI